LYSKKNRSTQEEIGVQIKILLIMCLMMLISAACKKTIKNEKNKSGRSVKSQSEDAEVLVETEYGNYVMDAEWFETQKISVIDEGFSHSYSKPDSVISNTITISYSRIPEEVDMSDHEVVKNRILKYNQKSEFYFRVTVGVEDYHSESHDEVFLFTFTDNQVGVVRREYVITKGQVMLEVSEEISRVLYTIPEQKQTEMTEVSERIAERALESFQWIN